MFVGAHTHTRVFLISGFLPVGVEDEEDELLLDVVVCVCVCVCGCVGEHIRRACNQLWGPGSKTKMGLVS